jgi:non-ribosomal peptide synthetase component E (peptide arylation enzyme)
MPTPISDNTVPWPEEDAARFAAAGYWRGIPLGHLVREVADRLPGATAVVDAVDGTRLSYAELARRADAAAARLLGLGLAAGDRIVVQLGNG